MERFWFDFHVVERSPAGPDAFDPFDDGAAAEWLADGVGVTAFDEQDALGLVRERAGGSLPPVRAAHTSTAADRRAMTIQPGRPVGNPSWRGVWFPTGDAATLQISD